MMITEWTEKALDESGRGPIEVLPRHLSAGTEEPR
jgi:hypothetical protein